VRVPRCNPAMRRVLAVAAVALTALVAASSAPTKEGARAHLSRAIPLAAAPGTTIRLAWTVDVPDDKGGRRPFYAGGMFVRLLSRTGAGSSFGFAREGVHPVSPYTTDVKVPAGGIGGVRVGLRGTTDIYFPLENDPFTSPGGARCDVAAVSGTLRAFVRAYNGGFLPRLDRLVSRKPFYFYASSGPGSRLLPEAKNRETLMAYFRRRHRQHDRLSLLSFRFNGHESQRELGHFELHGRRRADDFRGGEWFGMLAKGAVACSSAPVRIAALSLGGPPR
jgi:hypothetical protein